MVSCVLSLRYLASWCGVVQPTNAAGEVTHVCIYGNTALAGWLAGGWGTPTTTTTLQPVYHLWPAVVKMSIRAILY